MRFDHFDVTQQVKKKYALAVDPVCRKWNLTKNELDVLLFLHNNPEFDRAVDIVNNRGLSKSHVSLSISNLERRGFLERMDDPDDRRTVHLRLLPQLEQITVAGQLAQRRFFSYLHQGVTQEQIDLMVDFARKVNENIKNIEEVI